MGSGLVTAQEQDCFGKSNAPFAAQRFHHYLPVNSKGSAQGAFACLTPGMEGGYDTLSPRTPAGFTAGYHRGHLIARSLGGAPYNENIVPMTPGANTGEGTPPTLRR